jgi:hypothetical protein
MKPYVTAEIVEREIKSRRSTLASQWEPTPEAIASLINYYVRGAVTSISNHIYYAMEEGEAVALVYSPALFCRCGSCMEWQLIDESDRIVESVESLDEWVEQKK